MAVVGALEVDGVPYALVGGLAVAVWGAPRATKDIDLLVEPGDLDRAKAAVGRLGFTLPAQAMAFSDGMVVHRVSKIRDGGLITVDFLVVDRNLQSHFDQRQSHTLQGERVWVIGREGLIAMKVSAGRPQDQADVIRLKELDR